MNKPKTKKVVIIFLIAIIVFVLVGLIMTLRQNIVFVFDNSGTMTREVLSSSKETYQSFAKKNIENYIKDESKLFLTDIALVTIGGQCKSYDPKTPTQNLGATQKLHDQNLFKKREEYAKVLSRLDDSKKHFLDELNKIKEDPSGSTPLGFGIRAAAESLPQFSLNSKIYVITDGNVQDGKFKESGTGNCGEDVCTVFKEFKSKKFNFGVTVVPFGADPNNPLFKEYKKCGINVEPLCDPSKGLCSIPPLPPIVIPPIILIFLSISVSIPLTGQLIIWISKVRKQQTVMFMLDVSRSMADNDQSEKRKIDVAREAFKQIISLIRKSSSSEQSNQKVGFVAFGGKCGELRGKPIEPAYNNLRSIEEALNNPDYYEPDGSTPLAYAVQKVTTILKEQKEHERYLNWLNKFTPTIILITDGSDTCKGFPVNQIQEAKKQGINFVVIIIAYCINEWESDVKILPQIAEASNGYYFSAETEEELQERVEQSVTIQNTEKVDFKKGKLEKGKIQLISTMNNVKKWELWQTKNSSSFAVMESTDAGEHDVRVGDYELFVYFKDQQPVFRKKLSVRKNKTVVERV